MLQGFDPDGRFVVLSSHVLAKVIRGHPEMEGFAKEILQTVAQPEHRETDPHISGRRERYFRRSDAGRPWLRVVVEFQSPAEGVVVTAFPQAEDIK